MRHPIISSVITSFMLCGGSSIFVFGDKARQVEALNETHMLAERAADQGSSIAQSGCAVVGGKQLKSTDGTIFNIVFNISLGRLADESVAEINLQQSRITADSYTPDVLGFSMPTGKNGAELIIDDSRAPRRISDGTPIGSFVTQPLRQVKVPQTFLDIVVISQWEYELRFYRPEQVGAKRGKLYDLIGQPHVVYRFRNPNPPSENHLELTTIKDGIKDTSVYFYDAERDFWSLTKNGKEFVRKTSTVNPHNPCERIETRFQTKGSKVLKTIKIYKAFPWGQDLVTRIEEPDGEAKTTRYEYFEDPNGPHYAFLKTTIHPDGSIEQHNLQPDPTMPFRKP